MDRPCTKNGCQFSLTHSTQLNTRREEKKRKIKRNMETYHREGEERVWFRIMDRGSKISPGQKQMERTCFQPYSSWGEKELRGRQVRMISSDNEKDVMWQVRNMSCDKREICFVILWERCHVTSEKDIIWQWERRHVTNEKYVVTREKYVLWYCKWERRHVTKVWEWLSLMS